MLLRYLSTLFFCCNLSITYSQMINPRFESISVNEGLSQSTVNSVYQDSRGFMWFGTADGLNRYDGAGIKIYKVAPKQTSLPNSNGIRGNLCEDSHGNIWYSNETGIYFYSVMGDRIEVALLFESQIRNNVSFYGTGFDKKGNLWLFNPSSGIFSYSPSTKKFVHFFFPTTDRLGGMDLGISKIDKNGDIWFLITFKGGLNSFNVYTHKFRNYTSSKGYYNKKIDTDSLTYFFSIREGSNSYLDVYTKGQTYLRRIGFPFALEQGIAAVKVLADYKQRLWFTTVNQGLIMYDPVKNNFVRFLNYSSGKNSLPNNLTRYLFEDKQHNLWIGTDGGGVAKLDLKSSKFNLFPSYDGQYRSLRDYFVKSLYEDHRGRIWFGTLFNGICRFDISTGRLDSIGHSNAKENRFSTNLTGAFLEDSKGRIWAGSSMSIGYFDSLKNDFVPVPIDKGFSLTEYNNFIMQITELHDGNLIAATMHGLMPVFRDKKGNWKTELPPAGFARLYATTFVKEVVPGELWYTSPLNGLYHVEYRERKFRFIEKYFQNIDLKSIAIDEQNPEILWIASGIGLIKFNTGNKEFKIYGMEQGISNSYIYGILEDSMQNLWMSTNGGLAVFNKSTERFTNYNYKDGLQSNEFNTGAYFKSKSGNFYFGGINGFNWFNPSNVAVPGPLPLASVSQISINDVPLRDDSDYFYHNTLRLPYFRNSLYFQIAALDFTRPEGNRIEYRLKGWDSKPTTTYNREVRYSNLYPGIYQFVYRVMNTDGVWSNTHIVYISISPPFWKTWWFYSVLTIIIVTGIFFLSRYIILQNLRKRLHELEKNQVVEAERNRISRDMHDEIGSGLTQIALMSDLLQTRESGGKESYGEVKNISSSARRLVESMSEIIWALNPRNDSLENLLAYLREQTYTYFEPFDIHLIINFPETVPFVKLSNEQRRNLYLVAKESLNNSLKHAQASEITLQMDYKENSINFKVCDNGHGLNQNHIRHSSNGLKNMKKRMEDIGGTFEMESSGSGCTVLFSLLAPPEKKGGHTTFFTSQKR